MGAGHAAAFASSRLCGGAGSPAGHAAPGWWLSRHNGGLSAPRGGFGFIVWRGAARCPAATAPARLPREALGSWVYSAASWRLFCCFTLCHGVKGVWFLACRLSSVLPLAR